MHPNECQCRLGALFHACRGMVNRAPLLLPLMVVCGVICSGGVGWSVAGVALVIGCVLRAYRVTLCAFFCGMVVVLCAALRQREMDQLKLTDQPPPRIVQVQGTVIRTLNHGCIVESGVLGVRVVVYGDISAQLGESLSVVGELKPPEQPLVPGMFSQEEWMRGMGIVARLNCLRMECSNGDFGYATLLRAAERVRMVLVNRLMPSGTEKDVRRQVLCALVLGEKGRADDDTIDIFRRGGCLHAFAVSGLHVGIVASILWVLLRLCHLRPDWGRWVLIFGVGLYVFATGMAVPALRAYIMLSMVLGALMLRRRISFLNAWCYAALLVLMFQPWQFYQPGFRLSFMVYGAICLGVRYAMSNLPWFGPDSYIPVRIHTRWERWVVSADIFARGTVMVSMSAWLVSLPLSVLHFHVVNTASYVINILIAPLLPVAMFMGLLVLVVGGVPLIGGLVQTGALCSAGWLVSLVSLFASIPGAYLPSVPPAAAEEWMVVPLNYGKSACVLGNPGILVGDVRGERAARYVVQPALFHAGFSPVLCPEPRDAATASIYSHAWPKLSYFSAPPGAAPQCFISAAGTFTIFAPPHGLPVSYSANATPIIYWQRQDTRRFLFIGNAALSTFETLPSGFRRADVLILGYNLHEPIVDPQLLRSIGMKRIILFPRARGHGIETFFPNETAER